MSENNIELASAINLSGRSATVLLSTADLQAILEEVQRLRTDVESLRNVQKSFAIRTTNEIDELFAKVEARVQVRPGRKQETRMNKLEALLIARGKACTREQNMTHFEKRLDEAKDRFIVGFNRTSGGKLVHLTKDYYEHLRREYVG
jgi:hypothetical protein